MIKKSSAIYITSPEGLVGSALVKKLKEKGYKNLLLKADLDLTDQKKIEQFFKKSKPDYVFLLSAKEGGILANKSYPADFIYQNTMAQSNIINASFKHKVKKLLFLGSACSYPKICPQPIKEKYLLTGPVESTSESYALAKINGIKMCEAYNKQHKANFISAIPTNVYGKKDDFSKEGHVIAGLIRKFHTARIKKHKVVKIWGTGKPKREFLYVDDLADASIFLINKYRGGLINIAGGEEVSIKRLASILKKITGFKGKIVYETTKPDGMPRRILDSSKIFSLSWQPKISLEDGLKITYDWYRKNNK